MITSWRTRCTALSFRQRAGCVRRFAGLLIEVRNSFRDVQQQMPRVGRSQAPAAGPPILPEQPLALRINEQRHGAVNRQFA